MKILILETTSLFDVKALANFAIVVFVSKLLGLVTIEVSENDINKLKTIPGILNYRESKTGRVQPALV